jgi:hypothetical protein
LPFDPQVPKWRFRASHEVKCLLSLLGVLVGIVSQHKDLFVLEHFDA